MATAELSELSRRIMEAGIVGAGGAGFPTHIKANARAEIIVANGAECEPLMQKDQELMLRNAADIVRGMQMLMDSTGAKSGAVGVKAKHAEEVDALKKAVAGKPGLRVHELGDYYPAGDEYSLVYETTGRLIPQGGIPLQVGVVVNNVETLYNISRADKTPVVEKFITVAGAVKNPCTLRLPVGCSFSEAIGLAGGAAIDDFAVIDGGAMMGRVTTDLSEPVTKTTGGLIILPANHHLVLKKSAPRKTYSKIGRSCCDQCSYCTEFCPRYILGYSIQPHKVMRSLCFGTPERKVWSEWALLCCECNICSLYACPEDLDPRNICVSAKSDLREAGVAWKNSSLYTEKPPALHPMFEFRKVPIKRLVRRLGIAQYAADAPLVEKSFSPKRVKLPLKQHLGAPSVATVKAGQKVRKGELIADIAEKQLGAKIHASIDGTVKSVDSAIIIES